VHLVSIEFLRVQERRLSLASYDDRMLAAARRMRITVAGV